MSITYILIKIQIEVKRIAPSYLNQAWNRKIKIEIQSLLQKIVSAIRESRWNSSNNKISLRKSYKMLKIQQYAWYEILAIIKPVVLLAIKWRPLKFCNNNKETY